eukprot:Hpha_TRINITY_DN27523_c0_g1::TRINITY_DN27523_c0_g1_i1::g.86188::m.86188
MEGKPLGRNLERLLTWSSSWMMREDDTLEDRSIKRVVGPLELVLFLLLLLVGINAALFGSTFYQVCTGMQCFTSLLFIFGSLLGTGMARLLDVTLLLHAVATLGLDFDHAAQLGNSVWPFVIIILAAALVFERDHIIPVLLSLTLIYFVV